VSGRCTTVLTSVELVLYLGFALRRNSRAPAIAQPYDSFYLILLSCRLTPTLNSMSPLLNRLMPSSCGFNLAFLGVVLILDQIDIVNMHTVVRDIRDVIRAIRVSFGSELSSFMHRNELLRRCG
jgi:hypothetical protein